MTHRARRRLIAAAVVVVAGAGLAVALVRGSGSTASRGIASDTSRTIAAGGGVTLAAEVITPRGGGRPPLVVMPASWGQAESEYHAIGRMLAGSGYQVVAYAERGFGKSTGAVDFGGPATQHDVTTVIDWALAHTRADPARIGTFGVSYGAGISLLAAAHDRRIRAVAALSTWTDIAASFDPGSTPSVLGLRLLLGPTASTLRLTPDVDGLRRTLAEDPAAAGAVVRELSGTRSPMTYLARLNANRPAILLANAYEDSLFGPGQLVPFFTGLTGPKRLQLAPGDHAGPELGGLYGRPNSTVADARAWLDHYLRGSADGIDRAAPIQLRDAVTDRVHPFASWPTSTAAATLRPVQARATLAPGSDSVATSGPPQFFSFARYASPQIATGDLTATTAAVWTGSPVRAPTLVAGTLHARFTVASSLAGDATVIAYLYDVDASGTGRLISWQPITATGLSADRPRPLDASLPPTAWTLATGHRLALAVDRNDARYQSLTPAGATLSVQAAR